ncbi:MAG: UvrD-helicase domain-containing protein [Anaerolineae bacterium]|nr:UvrD-helicase domain-containing protein [Anaerolineae bacterium]
MLHVTITAMINAQHPLLHILNSQQIAAVTTSDGPVLVLAGPGSGKTRVLTHRVAWMLSEMGIPAWRVLAVTFTNKAAREMRHRLDLMLGDTSSRALSLGTFHATCARILRREADSIGFSPDYVIFDSADQVSVMKQVVKELGVDDKRYRPQAMLSAVSMAKNELLTPEQYPVHSYYDEIVIRAYRLYQDILRKNNGLDFDDLLMKTAFLFQNNHNVLHEYRERYQHILVDEFQDTNMAQYVILKTLAQAHRSLFVVADEDQSIYSWRGADYRNIVRLREDFIELQEFLLEENYRSTQIILDGAQAVITRNTDRTPKHLYTKKPGGTPIVLHEAYDEQEESNFIVREIGKLTRGKHNWEDIAIMYRTNAQSRALEETFMRHGIPYRLIGATRFYSRKEIKDIIAYLRLVHNLNDDVSFLRIVNTPSRGIGARTVAAVTSHAQARSLSLFHAASAMLKERGRTSRTYKVLAGFTNMVNRWVQLKGKITVAELVDYILDDTGYEIYTRDGSDQGESRWENILALRAVVADAPDIDLTDFLTEVALVADVDELGEDVEAVTMLTLHSAKGLEYPVVFLTGLEEGMLPHSRSMDSPQEIAEERRLLYVGMTRARDLLYLTYAFRRSWGRYGNNEPSAPSRFLEDIPDSVLGRTSAARKQPNRSGWTTKSWESETRQPVEYTPQQLQYNSGQRVHHTYYGSGVVIESQMEGRSEMVTVLFGNGIGVKKLLGSMAPMEVVPDH